MSWPFSPGEVKRTIEGIPTKEPVFQLPALWIQEKKKDEAQFAGYTVVDISTIIATHLTEVIRSHADELLEPPGCAETAGPSGPAITRRWWRN